MRLDEGSEPCLPEDVGQAGIAMQFMVALDQALTLGRQALRQETEITVLSLVGESRMTCIVSDRCHGFYRPASPRANRFRSMRQHNGSRHISSIDNRGHLHGKIIADAAAISVNPEEVRALIARTVAKMTHDGTKYCSAKRIFAEMSRISPEVWAIPRPIGIFVRKIRRIRWFGYFIFMKPQGKPYRFLPSPQRKDHFRRLTES